MALRYQLSPSRRSRRMRLNAQTLCQDSKSGFRICLLSRADARLGVV
jgi:hypothetical protein